MTSSKKSPHKFDINKMPRSRKAWERAISILNDGKHHYYLDIAHEMLEVSDLKPYSVADLLREMIKQELIREDPTGRWLFRPRYKEIELEFLKVSTPPDGVHTRQEETKDEVSYPQMEDPF